MYSYYLEAPVLYSFDGLAPLIGSEGIGAAVAMVGSVAIYMAIFVWAMMGEDRDKRKPLLVAKLGNALRNKRDKLSGRALFLWALGTTASFPVEHWAWENIGPMAQLATILGVGTK